MKHGLAPIQLLKALLEHFERARHTAAVYVFDIAISDAIAPDRHV